jgi:hypothetical protein
MGEDQNETYMPKRSGPEARPPRYSAAGLTSDF